LNSQVSNAGYLFSFAIYFISLFFLFLFFSHVPTLLLMHLCLPFITTGDGSHAVNYFDSSYYATMTPTLLQLLLDIAHTHRAFRSSVLRLVTDAYESCGRGGGVGRGGGGGGSFGGGGGGSAGDTFGGDGGKGAKGGNDSALSSLQQLKWRQLLLLVVVDLCHRGLSGVALAWLARV
jgi:uncharacterized membrane protein YgcG